MTKSEIEEMQTFMNRLRALSCIDGFSMFNNIESAFVHKGKTVRPERHLAVKFNADPYRFMRSADISTAMMVWKEMMKREGRN
jgi:hypothetical protein